jgi:ribosomal protein L39E
MWLQAMLLKKIKLLKIKKKEIPILVRLKTNKQTNKPA